MQLHCGELHQKHGKKLSKPGEPRNRHAILKLIKQRLAMGIDALTIDHRVFHVYRYLLVSLVST